MQMDSVGMEPILAAAAAQSAQGNAEDVIDSLRDPLLVLDEELYVVSANRAFYDTFRVSHEETIHRHVFQLGTGQWDTPELRRLFDKLVHSQTSFRDFEIGRTLPGIGQRIMCLSARPLVRSDGDLKQGESHRIRRILLTIEDVTVQQRTADALHQSEIRYRRLFEAARDGILLLDSDTGEITDANPFLVEMLGHSHDYLIGKELWQIGLFTDRDASHIAFRQLQEKGYLRYENLPLETRRGERREVEVVSNVYIEGEHTVIQCNIRDITERKRIQTALETSETRYRRLFETAQDGILILDFQTGTITDVNPYIAELLGCEPNDLLGKELWEIGLLANQEASQSAFRRLHEEGYIRYDNLPLLTRQGERREVKFTCIVYVEGDHTVIQCNIRDITERKRIEKALAVVQAREHHIAETLQRPLIVGVPEDAFPGLLVATLYAPASSEALVGGDFHDAFTLPDGRVAMAVADTLGKGLFAAARTMQIKDVLRAFARESSLSPADVVERVNRFACGTQRFDGRDDGMFTCLVLLFLDPLSGEGQVVYAGCEPPVVLRADSDVLYLPMANSCLPLGIAPDTTYSAISLRLEPGDTLILMTDGITEARAPATEGSRDIAFLETEGAVALAQQVRETHTLHGMGEAILDGARRFAGGALHDDACLLLARLQS